MLRSNYLALLLSPPCFLLLTALTLPPAYSAPRPPDGFRIKLNYQDVDEPLNPAGIYLCAIEALAVWAGPAWDSTVDQDRGMEIPELNVGLKTVIIAEPDARDQLKLSHVLLGLYQAVLAITEDNRFRVFSAGLYKDDFLTGVLAFHRLSSSVARSEEGGGSEADDAPPPKSNGNSNNNNDASSSLMNPPPPPITSAANTDSGHYIHPRFPWLRLDWTFSGRRIHASDIFTTIMDAIVSTADELGTRHFLGVTGVSAFGDVAMNFHGVTWAPPMTNNGAQNVLLMVAREVFVRQRRFQEVDFSFSDHGRRAGEGWFLEI
ncbi:MAG: hypothetical protein LQ346_006795 [Caloplaca aetnensis]|nr:MAG: hypothetical protein LQ346_006795 [Caloplaca aetnensis]